MSVTGFIAGAKSGPVAIVARLMVTYSGLVTGIWLMVVATPGTVAIARTDIAISGMVAMSGTVRAGVCPSGRTYAGGVSSHVAV